MFNGSSSRAAVVTIDSWPALRTKFGEASKSNTPVVLEFMAPWSELSRAMEQPFREFASSYNDKDIQFIAVDFDKLKNLGRSLRVEALPTFVLVKNMSVEDRVVAVDRADLNTKMGNMIDVKTSAKCVT